MPVSTPKRMTLWLVSALVALVGTGILVQVSNGSTRESSTLGAALSTIPMPTIEQQSSVDPVDVTAPTKQLPGAPTMPVTAPLVTFPKRPKLIADHFASPRCSDVQSVDVEVTSTLDSALRLTDAVILFTAGESKAPSEPEPGPFPNVLTDVLVDRVIWNKGRIIVPPKIVIQMLGSANNDGTFSCIDPVPIFGQRYVAFLAEFKGLWRLTWSRWGIFAVEPSGALDAFDDIGGFSKDLNLDSADAMAAALAKSQVKEDGWAADRAAPGTVPVSTNAAPPTIGPAPKPTAGLVTQG